MRVRLFFKMQVFPTIVATVAGMLISTNVLAKPVSGEFDGSTTPDKAGWKVTAGNAGGAKSIIDLEAGNKAYKIAGGSLTFRKDFGKWSDDDFNRLNQVEIRWASTSPKHAGAAGLMVGSVERRFFFFPTAAEVNASLKPGTRGFILTKKVPKYDPAELNTYRLEWTTAEGGKYKFRFFVNGIDLGEYAGYVNGSGIIFFEFEIRNGEHTIDYIRWGLNGGKMPGAAAVQPQGKLTTTWGSVKNQY